MVELRLFGSVQHQTHAATVKEGQLAGREQQRQAEDITIEGGGAGGVVDVDGDLSDAGDTDRRAGNGPGTASSIGSSLTDDQ
jgi:hypothetical protein